MEINEKWSTMEFYDIETITAHDIQEVEDIVDKFFYKNEPICNALNISTADMSDSYAKEPEICSKGGCSLKAVAKSGKIIGVALSLVIDRDMEKDNEIEQIPNSKCAILDKYLKSVHAKFNVFKRFLDVEKFLHLRIIAVDTAWRKMDVAYNLIHQCRHMGRKNGCNLIMIHCTSSYSAKVAEKLGYERMFTSKYADFIKSDGSPYFVPEHPHEESSIYVLRI